MTTDLKVAEPPKALRLETWRVLKRDEDTVPTVTRWIELEPLTGEGEHGYYISAEILGEEYGEGDYILICEEGYATVQMVEVVAEHFYSFDRNE